MVGTATITLTATATDTANMDPPLNALLGGSYAGGFHSNSSTIHLTIVDPCVSPTLTQLIAPTIADASIQIGDPI